MIRDQETHLDERDGESLDRLSLSRHLQKVGIGEVSEVRQFTGGSSNLTYLVRAGGHDYVLRRPPFGNTVKTAHDMDREYRVLSKLSAVYQLAPKPLLYCDDPKVIGTEFYLMEHRGGVIVRGRLSAAQLPESYQLAERFEIDRAYQKEVCRSFIRTLAELHSIDPASAGLSELGIPEGYNRRQVEGWTKRYFAAKTHDWPELENAIAWLNDLHTSF